MPVIPLGIRNKTHICKMSIINRELSWLSFNERVLQEALDSSVPVVERMRFLGIYSNNLDEFYRVRVANIKRMIHLQNKKVEGFKGSAQELYDEIRSVVIKQQRKFELAYANIQSALAEDGITIINEKTVSTEQVTELQFYFKTEVIHNLVPIIIDKKSAFPRINDKAIYLAVRMEWDQKQKTRYAIIEIPSTLSRFYELNNGNQRNIILIDDIIRLHLAAVFPIFSFDFIEAYTFKFTRDAELNLDDDVSMSFIEKMEKSIKLRKKGDPVRVVYDHQMPEDLLDVLTRCFHLSPGMNTIPGGRYHNFKDFMRFPSFGNSAYRFPSYQPSEHPFLSGQQSIIKQLLKKDVLLHFPYQQFDHVVDLLREAAIDPKVKSIKINVYRVAQHSQVMNALINAVRNGKEVTAILELQARFDEEHNLYWTERLKEEGAKVIHGHEGMKIHSKLLQIKRISEKKEQLISYIGTGNFNEQTAQIYTDFALLTCNRKLSLEVAHVFEMMEHSLHHYTFRELMVSPLNSRRKITQLINTEIKHAKEGKPAGIQLKLNNLVDLKLINKLYEASNAGVNIQLIIRGVCCLLPNLKNKSENISIISIIDRFLEHARVLIFQNNGNPKYYISSADWMERNMDKRIEVGTPIYDPELKEELQFVFDTQWNDTVKARILDKKQLNKHQTSPGKQLHSQIELMHVYRNKLQ